MGHSLLLCRQLLVTAIRAAFFSASAVSVLATTYLLYILVPGLVRSCRSPLRNVPGPKKAHWLKGNFVDVREQDSSYLQEEWVRTYGHVTRYSSYFGVRYPSIRRDVRST